MALVPLVRLFLSSPGDVYEERAIVHEEIEALVNHPAFREKVAFRVIAWDKKGAGTVMRFRMPPQEAINKGLPMPSQCDIVVVIFWSRLGTAFTALDGKAYLSGTHYELMEAIESPRPEVVIYKRDETPYFDPDAPDFKTKNEQYQALKSFLKTEVFFDPQTGSPRAVTYYPNSEDFRLEFRTTLAQLVLDFLQKAPSETETLPTVPQITPIEASIWHGSPFPSLRSFTFADAPIFFGRGREAESLIKRLSQSRFVAVVGASGSGKSSLVAAGILPRLLERNAIYNHQTASENWRIVQFTPTSHQGQIYSSPFEALYYALLEVFPQLVDNPLRAQRVKREFLEDTLTDPQALCEACKFLLSAAPIGSEVLLYIDQFEELFTLAPLSERKPFVALLDAASRSPQMRVILTMRADFYQHCVDLPVLANLLQQGSFPLSTPLAGALYEMIQAPADRAALKFEEGLVQQILTDTGESSGALALLAYALDELYKLAEQRGDRQIRFSDYEALGGVHGAIGKRAEAVFQTLAGEEALKDGHLQKLFHALVSVNDEGIPTRQRVHYQAEKAEALTQELVESLTKARLLTKDNPEKAHVTLEVAHEALFRSWERLKKWIAEAQEDLILLRQVKNAALDWGKRGRPDFLRWNHERLRLVYAMQTRITPQLTNLETAFIEAEQERLYRELKVIETTHERRRDIGDRLAVIGDTRAGVGMKDGLPDIAWLPVQGSNGKHKFGFGEFAIPDFYIAEYLITYVQYQAFVEAAEDGYQNKDWWHNFPEKHQLQQLSGARVKLANAPRDNISWYQSVAFSRWLDARYRETGLMAQFVSNLPVSLREKGLGDEGKWRIRLPTEWEWQWAAQNGTETREYPWGDWHKGYANTNEAGLSRSTSVGIYPQGAAACGALDVAGNLWEWCANNYDNPKITDPSNANSKVSRGGSFDINQSFARSMVRFNYDPSLVLGNFGFRLVFAPI